MLFNSYSFIFLFLPLTCLGYALLGLLRSRKISLTWIVLCSIVFYGAWNPANLLIIAPSIAVNYVVALMIRQAVLKGADGQRQATVLLTLGILFNLSFLGYFKYKNFFLETVNMAMGTDFVLTAVILPLGISFITFQKIAFLVDVRSETIQEFDIYDFLVFVFFFPQLIAGPIVHYREMMPQFDRLNYRFNAGDVAVGLSLFAMGLFKKVMLADGVAVYASPVFASAEQGQSIDFFTAWIGALAYTFQIYFDFSGYSDMAIGLGRLFGIRLPVNFNSPLKASSIIDFWSRWHITLTRFLTAYVYTPVMMNLTRRRMAKGMPVLSRRKPNPRTFLVLVMVPTMLTMLLSGFWHGAGFTFLIWGALHGLYLCINHAWRTWRPDWNKQQYERVARPLGFVLTFVAVVVGMVLFRAHTVGGALQMLHGMAGFDGISLPNALLQRFDVVAAWLGALGVTGNMNSGLGFVTSVAWLATLFLIIMLAPNSLELLRDFEPALLFKVSQVKTFGSSVAGWLRLEGASLRFNWSWGLFVALSFVLGVFGLNRVSEFLYWQF